MAYQGVGTPRFYVDHGLWLSSIGGAERGYWTGGGNSPASDAVSLALVKLDPTQQLQPWNFVHVPRVAPITYTAYLNHNLASIGGFCYPEWHDGTSYQSGGERQEVNGSMYNTPPESNGFSLFTFPDFDYPFHRAALFDMGDPSFHIGAISVGSYYDMPRSPELNLTLTRELDGVKRVRTKGGADLVDHKYLRPPKWGKIPAWQLADANYSTDEITRIGRRTWDLSFSHLGSKETLGLNNVWSSIVFSTEGYSEEDDYFYNSDHGNLFDASIFNHDSFFSQVLFKTMGGKLRFIFQPDSNNNNPDQFAICKLDMDSFQASQVANGVYNIKLKIREVW